MSTRGFINPGVDGNTPDTTNTAPVAGVHACLWVTEYTLCVLPKLRAS